MNELKDKLSAKGIETVYKYRSGTDEVQGVSFTKDGYAFKGSEIDRSMSYGNLIKSIEADIEQDQRTAQKTLTLAEQMRQALQEKHNDQVQLEEGLPLTITKNGIDTEIASNNRSIDPAINIADDIDDEAIHGRNRRRKQQVRINTR
jgi:hypothetical protein